MSGNRKWMYRRFLPSGNYNPEFVEELDRCIKFASSKPAYMDIDKISCPCKKCDNKSYRDTDEVQYHICRFGFVKNYQVWRFQGESLVESESVATTDMDFEAGASTTYHTMVLDAHSQFDEEDIEEEPLNHKAQQLYDI